MVTVYFLAKSGSQFREVCDLRCPRLQLERFRTSAKYQDRPAAAYIAFCVAAYANGMTEDRIERALEDDYLSRDPSTSKAICLNPEDYGEGEEMGRARA
jgi:hypothetical protein